MYTLLFSSFKKYLQLHMYVCTYVLIEYHEYGNRMWMQTKKIHENSNKFNFNIISMYLILINWLKVVNNTFSNQ